MKAWRAFYPNPGKPKPDTSLPNLGSPKQLLTAFQALGIPAEKTGAEKLKELEDDYPAIKILVSGARLRSSSPASVRHCSSSLIQDRTHPSRVCPDRGEHRPYVLLTSQLAAGTITGDGKKLRTLVTAEPGH